MREETAKTEERKKEEGRNKIKRTRRRQGGEMLRKKGRKRSYLKIMRIKEKDERGKRKEIKEMR